MKHAVFLFVFLLPLFSHAIDCVGVNTYATGDTTDNYPWKPLKVKFDDATLYNATLTDGTCTVSISHSSVNGDTYYVSASDSAANMVSSGLSAFDSKGNLQFTLVNGASATVCAIKCTK